MNKDLKTIAAEHFYYSENLGLACTGVAKIIIEKLAKIGISAYAYDIDTHQDGGHTFVIYEGQHDDTYALNQLKWLGLLSVAQVKQGKNVTQDIVNSNIEDHRL